MSLQHAYETWKAGWTQDCHEDGEKCVCNGYGWVNSPFDTWHHCPVHFDSQRHPEDPTWVEVDVVEAHKPGGESVFQVVLTVGYAACDDIPAVDYLHFHEFSSEERARKWGEKIAPRQDIEDRVGNEEYWTCISVPDEFDHAEMAGEEMFDRLESKALAQATGAYRGLIF